MAFTYNSCDGTDDAIDFVRLLISDTQSVNHIFEDSEILGFYRIQGNVFQSSMFFSGADGTVPLPSSPVSYARVAALALDSLAANKSRLSSVIQILDVKLSPDKAAQALRDQADQYRTIEDENGAFVVIEQVNNDWSFKERFWKQWQRQAAGAVAI